MKSMKGVVVDVNNVKSISKRINVGRGEQYSLAHQMIII